MRYSHDTWSIELPSGWQVDEDSDVIGFFHPNGCGIFEVSTFFADDGDISEEEIREFAEVETPDSVNLKYLSGVYKRESEEGDSIDQWWLSSGNQLLYATYTCPVGQDNAEAEEREQLIQSLRSLIGANAGAVDE